MNATRRDMICSISFTQVCMAGISYISRKYKTAYLGNQTRKIYKYVWSIISNCNEGRQMNELCDPYVIAEHSSGYNVSSISKYMAFYIYFMWALYRNVFHKVNNTKVKIMKIRRARTYKIHQIYMLHDVNHASVFGFVIRESYPSSLQIVGGSTHVPDRV